MLEEHVLFPHLAYSHILVNCLIILLLDLEELAVRLRENRSRPPGHGLLRYSLAEHLPLLVPHRLFHSLYYRYLSILVHHLLFVSYLHDYSSAHQNVKFISHFADLIQVFSLL